MADFWADHVRPADPAPRTVTLTVDDAGARALRDAWIAALDALLDRRPTDLHPRQVWRPLIGDIARVVLARLAGQED